MDGAGAGGAARERRKQLTAAEAVNHKRQLAQMVERELALTGAQALQTHCAPKKPVTASELTSQEV